MRQKEYGAKQNKWKRNRNQCIVGILDQLGEVVLPERRIIEPYWATVMTTASDDSPIPERVATIGGAWIPITKECLKLARIPRASAAGPDGVSARLFQAIPPLVLVKIYNLLMWCESLLEDLLLSRTVFLPKKKEANDPGDFRPITIPPVLVRGLHRILAVRLERALNIDSRQRAFKPTDGCSDNVFLLDTLLRFHRKKYQSLYVASLDVAKAFNTVTHATITATLQSLGVPSPMINYLQQVYERSKTRMEGDDWVSQPIHPVRGARKVDPLSPILFNVITHRMLLQLLPEVGARMEGVSVNVAAFADDLLLFAATPGGLQRMIDIVSGYLDQCGMVINTNKSMTISIKAAPQQKKTAVDILVAFKCGNQQLSRSSQWRYLGITFTPKGRAHFKPAHVVSPILEALTRAPLKPQQRLFALRTVVVPRLYHQIDGPGRGNNWDAQ